MIVGIISDTHDDLEAVNKAIEVFEQNSVEIVIHAGDFISPPIISEFQRLTDNNVKFYGVFGNNDGERKGLEKIFESIGGKLLGDLGKIEIDGMKFGIYHGTDVKKREKMCNSGKFDVCVFGHSHNREPDNNNLKMINDTIIFNPGNAHRSYKLRYLQKPYFFKSSVIIFETKSKEFKFHDLE
mgnify:CR=1 FL=1